MLLLLQMLRQTHARCVGPCVRPCIALGFGARVLALEVCNGCRLCLGLFGCWLFLLGDSGLLECLTSPSSVYSSRLSCCRLCSVLGLQGGVLTLMTTRPTFHASSSFWVQSVVKAPS